MHSEEKKHPLRKVSTSTDPCKDIILESETLSYAEQGCSCPLNVTNFLPMSEKISPNRALLS